MDAEDFRQRLADETPESGGSLDYGVLEQISSREIMDQVATLPQGLRSVFNLFVLDGYSHAEVGAMLGITEQSSRSQVSRARSLLQEKIKKLYERKK